MLLAVSAVTRVLFALPGPFAGTLVTHAIPRRPGAPRLTVRRQTEAMVRVERRVQGRWVTANTLGTESEQQLVKLGGGTHLRLWVEGESPGLVDLLEHRD
jgi:hypothetical protein